jgi:hypothetical protein
LFSRWELCNGRKRQRYLHQDQAAAQLGERRDKVLKTLSRIPSVIAQAEHCVQTFPDQELYDRVVDVYVEALKTIEEITKWLKQHPIRK